MHLRSILLVSLLLSACMSLGEWEIFADRGVNITFAHDPAYVRDAQVTEKEIQFGDERISVAGIDLRKGQGEAPFIGIMQTKDPRIVSYLVENSLSSRQVLVDKMQAQVFVSEGIGEPVQYLFRKNDLYIVLSFVFPPSQQDIDRTLSSVVLR